DGVQIGASIPKSGTYRQVVRTTGSRIVVVDDDSVKIFDKDGLQKGATIARTGQNRQAVKLDGDRVIVIDDDRVRIFDEDGAAKGAPITRTGTNRQQVVVCGGRVIVIDDDRARVFDRDGGAVGAPVTNTGSSRQRVQTSKDRIVITDDNRTEIFDKDMNVQGAPIAKTGTDAQVVTVSDDAVVIVDQDRTRIFDKFGAQQGGDVMKTGWDTQKVRIEGDRILITDTDQVRCFDLSGSQVGAAIPVTYVEEYDVLLFEQFFTIVDDFTTVTIYDRDANQLGQPIAVGYGVQHVQASHDRILVIDDQDVRTFDASGNQLGSTITTQGEPWAQPVCFVQGSVETFGVGCGGMQQFAYGDARMGGTLTYEVYGPSSALGMMGLGFEAFATPLDLAAFGAPGCHAYAGLAITYPVLTDTEGFAAVQLTLPGVPAAVGHELTTQFFAVDLSANNLGIVSSDAARTAVGEGL
ncbi:MAG: hypothetical protein KAI24_07915, partial [Planctomycetes bacterium]|nr:hypothetical protein [Planctomycetota bacterium]